MKDQRGQWYLLTGLVCGLLMGLIVSLKIMPQRFEYNAPQSLSAESKSIYRGLIALAYNADRDYGRANARLTLLQDVNPGAVFSAQAQKLLASGGDVIEANALSILGQTLTKREGSPTEAPAATPTPQPTVEEP